MRARRRMLALAALLCGPPPAAADEPAPAPPRLIAATAPPAAPAPAPAGDVPLRIYEGFGVLGPVRGIRDPAFATDVTVGLVNCGDGSTAVGALALGGWHYTPERPCAADSRGEVRLAPPNAAAAPAAPARAEPAAPAAATAPATPAMRCDPSAWRCTPTP
jgi:hypothetical protein